MTGRKWWQAGTDERQEVIRGGKLWEAKWSRPPHILSPSFTLFIFICEFWVFPLGWCRCKVPLWWALGSWCRLSHLGSHHHYLITSNPTFHPMSHPNLTSWRWCRKSFNGMTVLRHHTRVIELTLVSPFCYLVFPPPTCSTSVVCWVTCVILLSFVGICSMIRRNHWSQHEQWDVGVQASHVLGHPHWVQCFSIGLWVPPSLMIYTL